MKLTLIRSMIGCTVKVFDITFDEEMEFKIVGSTEANSCHGKHR